MMKPLTMAEIDAIELQEFLMVVGRPKGGKTHQVLEIAKHWAKKYPENIIHVIDLEGKILKEFKKRYSYLTNIEFWRCNEVHEPIEALHEIIPNIKLNDWLVVDSSSQMWEWAIDLAYEVVSGLTKNEYISRFVAKNTGRNVAVTDSDDSGKMRGKKEHMKGVAPDPANLWQSASNTYSRNFMDVISRDVYGECHILIIASEKMTSGRKASSEAKKTKTNVLGDNLFIEGRPRDAYKADTILYLLKEGEEWTAKVLGDYGYEGGGRELEFDITDKCLWKALKKNRKTRKDED